MDNSQAQPPAQAQAPAAQPMMPQHSNLIRTDQVQKLPHLNDQQKAQHTQLVRTLWEHLNTREPQSPEYQQAHTRLTQISQNLMKGMRAFQQNRQMQHQQMQAASAAQQGQPVQRSQSVNPQTFAQLLPQIQQKVNTLQFFLPPNISNEQAQTWLPEAKLRYGIALQKQEIGRARIADLRQQFAARQAAGNMTQEEVQEFKNRQLAAEKLYREGSDFLNKFKEQQDSFKAQQQRAGVQQHVPAQAHPQQAAAQTATGPAPTSADGRPPSVPATMHPGQTPTPAPHTITSAVSAARNQAGQTAMSPSTSQPGQTPTAQGPGAAPAVPAAVTPQPPPPPQQQQQQQQQQVPQQQPQVQAQSQQGPPGSQVTFTQVPNVDGSTPTPTPAQTMVQGPPRPLSQQAAMAQAAQSYSNNNNNNNVNNNSNNMGQQQTMTPGANTHAHPPGYIPNRSADNSARSINMAIPKNLSVPPPEPVNMAPARPTLSGGPSHAAVGVMNQPAIQKHPGYVLEGEGQRVLSKKMLDILVRQVTGGGDGEGLTPDAEEVIRPCSLDPTRESQY